MNARHPLVRFGPILGLLFLPPALACVSPVAVIVNLPPDCTGATVQPDELWPPDHEYVRVRILGVTDPDGDPVAINVTGVRQDEPVLGMGSGDLCPDAAGLIGASPWVRAERAGGGNGRVYHIKFTAIDPGGAGCFGEVTVCVPRNQGAGGCVDGGALFSSTICP